MVALTAALLHLAPPAQANRLEGLFAPRAEYWERWAAHDPSSTRSVDHGDWTALLSRHVRIGSDGVARFAYGAIGPEDRDILRRYIERLAAVTISTLSRPQQFAYWVNLYNALTVQVVLDAYPVASIRDIDISPGLFADGPWGRALVRVEGTPLSLNDIEHRILRPIWKDPRIHYAVNCASIGCPDLAAEAFSADRLDAMLDHAARAYVNHPRGVRVDGEGVTASRIYLWFMEDFGGSDAAVLEHLRLYAKPGLASALQGRTAIQSFAYDWSLNDAR